LDGKFQDIDEAESYAFFNENGKRVEPRPPRYPFLDLEVGPFGICKKLFPIDIESSRSICTVGSAVVQNYSTVHALLWQPAAQYSPPVLRLIGSELKASETDEDKMAQVLTMYGVAVIVDFVESRGKWRPRPGLEKAMLEAFRATREYVRKAS
jgi:hypothetical protein